MIGGTPDALDRLANLRHRRSAPPWCLICKEIGQLDGWRNQQLARRLAFSTVEGRERAVRAFAAHADAFPWEWAPGLVDEWMTDLRAVRRLRRSTLRGYQIAVRLFCGFTDQSLGYPARPASLQLAA